MTPDVHKVDLEEINCSVGARAAQSPLVSILVPSYNHEQYITECLNSIYALDYPRLELIVSDDCSRDDTFEVAKQWIERHANRFERSFVVRQEQNRGLVANFQWLFDAAKGTYLAPIASDDLFLRSALNERIAIFEEHRTIDAVFADAENISATGAVLRSSFMSRRRAKVLRRLSSRTLLAASLMLDWVGSGPIIMLRRDAVCPGGSLGPLPIDLPMEDIYIYIRLAAQGRLAFANTVVAKYRISADSLTHRHFRSMDNVRGRTLSFQKVMGLMTGFNLMVCRNRLSRYELQLAGDDGLTRKIRMLQLRVVTVLLKGVLILACVPMRRVDA